MLNFNYIIVDKKSHRAAIVDPAWDREQILSIFNKLGVKPDCILLTHSHIDHVHMVPFLVEQFDAQVYMSAKEIDFYHFKSRNLHSFQDFEDIMLGETRITCLLTPGHTAGGTCFLLADSLFTGDTIFTEGCGICTTLGGSPEQMFESIQKVKRLVEPHICIYPGHSYGKEPGQSMESLLRNNIYFQFEKKEHFIQFRMRKNQKNVFRTQ
jgi:glyoxylase-like metal-dependent hydrolase (beta-lactamase superfamily II)